MKKRAKEYLSALEEMKKDILSVLSKLEKGYGKRKRYISEQTGIPENILKPLLKELKDTGKIELIMIWNESTGLPNGSGYCLKGGLKTS